MRFRLRAPLTANPRVENLFKRASFTRAAKHYGAKFLSIQVPGVRKNPVLKFAANFFFNFRVKIDEPVCFLIGVEEFGGWNELAQTLAKAGLACGNSAGDPDDSHSNED
jgi:hypothetical protein